MIVLIFRSFRGGGIACFYFTVRIGVLSTLFHLSHWLLRNSSVSRLAFRNVFPSGHLRHCLRTLSAHLVPRSVPFPSWVLDLSSWSHPLFPGRSRRVFFGRLKAAQRNGPAETFFSGAVASRKGKTFPAEGYRGLARSGLPVIIERRESRWQEKGSAAPKALPLAGSAGAPAASRPYAVFAGARRAGWPGGLVGDSCPPGPALDGLQHPEGLDFHQLGAAAGGDGP